MHSFHNGQLGYMQQLLLYLTGDEVIVTPYSMIATAIPSVQNTIPAFNMYILTLIIFVIIN